MEQERSSNPNSKDSKDSNKEEIRTVKEFSNEFSDDDTVVPADDDHEDEMSDVENESGQELEQQEEDKEEEVDEANSEAEVGGEMAKSANNSTCANLDKNNEPELDIDEDMEIEGLDNATNV